VDIIDRILAGQATIEEVKQHNIDRMDRWFAKGPSHSADGCRNKNCIHGPRDIDVAHRNTLAQELGR